MVNIQSFFPSEEVQFSREGYLVKNLFNAKTGTFFITDKRIAFIEKKVVVRGHEIIEIADKLLKVSHPKLKVNIPFEELKNYSWVKRHDLVIENLEGEKFKLRPVDEKEVIDYLPKINPSL